MIRYIKPLILTYYLSLLLFHYLYYLHTTYLYYLHTTYLYYLHNTYLYYLHTTYIYYLHTTYLYYLHLRTFIPYILPTFITYILLTHSHLCGSYGVTNARRPSPNHTYVQLTYGSQCLDTLGVVRHIWKLAKFTKLTLFSFKFSAKLGSKHFGATTLAKTSSVIVAWKLATKMTMYNGLKYSLANVFDTFLLLVFVFSPSGGLLTLNQVIVVQEHYPLCRQIVARPIRKFATLLLSIVFSLQAYISFFGPFPASFLFSSFQYSWQ